MAPRRSTPPVSPDAAPLPVHTSEVPTGLGRLHVRTIGEGAPTVL